MKSDIIFSFYFVWKGDETLLNRDRILSALFNSQMAILLCCCLILTAIATRIIHWRYIFQKTTWHKLLS